MIRRGVHVLQLTQEHANFNTSAAWFFPISRNRRQSLVLVRTFRRIHSLAKSVLYTNNCLSLLWSVWQALYGYSVFGDLNVSDNTSSFNIPLLFYLFFPLCNQTSVISWRLISIILILTDISLLEFKVEGHSLIRLRPPHAGAEWIEAGIEDYMDYLGDLNALFTINKTYLTIQNL